MKDTIHDTITVKQTVIDTVHRVVADSVTSDVLLKSQELYNTSFSNIQNSFSNFLIAVSIITGVLAIFIGTLVFINFRSVENSKKEIKEELSKIKNFEKKIEEMKTEFKKDIENDRINFKSNIDNILREIATYYMLQAVEDWENWKDGNESNVDKSEHFNKLAFFYSFLTRFRLEISDFDVKDLNYLGYFIAKYNDCDLPKAVNFLKLFFEYKKYCANIDKPNRSLLIEKLWQKLCKVFCGEDKIFKAINDHDKRFKE